MGIDFWLRFEQTFFFQGSKSTIVKTICFPFSPTTISHQPRLKDAAKASARNGKVNGCVNLNARWLAVFSIPPGCAAIAHANVTEHLRALCSATYIAAPPGRVSCSGPASILGGGHAFPGFPQASVSSPSEATDGVCSGNTVHLYSRVYSQIVSVILSIIIYSYRILYLFCYLCAFDDLCKKCFKDF